MYNSFFTAYTWICIFVVTRRIEILCETNLIHLFHFLICAHSVKTLDLWLSKELVRKDLLIKLRKKKKNQNCTCLLFLSLCPHSQCKWMANAWVTMSEKEYDRVSWSFVFLITLLVSFCFWNMLVQWQAVNVSPDSL